MNVGDLVNINGSYPELGIGFVSKVYKHRAVVLLGINAIPSVFFKKDLVRIDTSTCKTVTVKEYATRILKDNSTLNKVILGHTVMQYVGIGWVPINVVTEKDLQQYPIVK